MPLMGSHRSFSLTKTPIRHQGRIGMIVAPVCSGGIDYARRKMPWPASTCRTRQGMQDK